MLGFEDANEALSRIADALPGDILKDLNGGIILSPDVRLHQDNLRGDLYTMGEYHVEPRGMGRYVTIYYGSFERVFGYLPDAALIEELKKTLYHELTHHLEHMAGDRSLEVEDAVQMAKYLKRHYEED